LSTEGVYSRDTGRSNSREGGGRVAVPVPVRVRVALVVLLVPRAVVWPAPPPAVV